MKSKLKKTLTSALIGASLIFLPAKSSAKPEKIFSQQVPVSMKNDYGKEFKENVSIECYLDKEKDTLYFINKTQNYNNKEWGKKEIAQKKFTQLSNLGTRIFILHPKKVKILTPQETESLVPQHKEKRLIPFEENKKARLTIKFGEKLIDYVLKKSKIPFAKKMYDLFIRYSSEKAEKMYSEMFEKVKKDYTYTEIPIHTRGNLTGSIPTARIYEIPFDMSKVPKGKEIPMSLWAKLAFGDSSKAPAGSFPNKYGQLENILITFSLKGKENLKKNLSENKSLEEYFFQGKELEYIKISSKKEEGCDKNPCIKINEKIKKSDDETSGIKKAGIAKYIIPQRRDSMSEKDLTLIVLEFGSKKQREEFEKKINAYPSFSNGKIFSFFETPDLDEVIDPFGRYSWEQQIIYLKLIKDYQKRTNTHLKLDKNEEESKRLRFLLEEALQDYKKERKIIEID